MIDLQTERRRRLTHRAVPVGLIAVAALTAGALVGSLTESGAERTARLFGQAWARGDLAAMHRMLTPAARARIPGPAFRRAYTQAAATATAERFAPGEPAGEEDGRVRLPVQVRTRVFGRVRGEVLLPVEEEAVAWEPHLVFPGVPPGASLRRRSRPPRRARLLSRDGKVLAEGPAGSRGSPLGELAASIAGQLEPATEPAERRRLHARGFPPSWPVGKTGLERALERDLAGRPGGELSAGQRVLARSAPVPARPVRTTIDTGLQQTAVAALAGRFGGIAALDARTAEIRALAGVAFSAPQPPGSTFKVITTTAALEARRVGLRNRFPVQTKAVIDGVDLANANGESCGGTFRQSFAHSCNSVFAPLGVRVGARRLVDAAERYGFNTPPTVPGEAPSTLPPASEIRSPLELGSTAIGQGKVLATPLMLASVAQTVAAGGVRTLPSMRPGARRPVRRRVTSARVARALERLMLDVVAYGTGTAAAIPGARVAGKTGTAELGDTRGPNAQGSDPSNTDAWFTSFAPAGRPRLAVAVLLVRAGAGGQVAAPAARLVLQAGL